MMPLLLASLLLFSSVNMTWFPFVFITEVSPESPMIYDMVAVTWRVVTDDSVPITAVQWDFGDGTGGVDTHQNMTGTFYITDTHVYGVPGDYYVRVGVVDALNRTAQDVVAVTVQPRATVITFNVNPVNVNSSLNEHFVLEAHLASDQGVPLNDQPLGFWYSSNGTVIDNRTVWYSVGSARTGNDGSLILPWLPPFDGSYQFKATFDGNDLYAPSVTEFNLICQRTPEFPSFIPPLMFSLCFVLFAAVSRRMKRMQGISDDCK